MVMFAVVMFGSIITAVTLSTVIIMSLMGGSPANALTTQNNNTQSGVAVCVDPTATPVAADAASAGVQDGDVVATGGTGTTGLWKLPVYGNISGSFNTTNHNSTSTSTTTNTTSHTTNVNIHDNGNSYSANWNNGNSYSANWNNGNTNTYAPTNNTSNTTVTSQNNGNTNNQNNGNSATNTTNNTANTSNTSNTTNVNVSDNEVNIED